MFKTVKRIIDRCREFKGKLYLGFVTKNHSFLDGNKRIAATMFLYFLDKNGVLFADGGKLIDDHMLVSLKLSRNSSALSPLPKSSAIITSLFILFLLPP